MSKDTNSNELGANELGANELESSGFPNPDKRANHADSTSSRKRGMRILIGILILWMVIVAIGSFLNLGVEDSAGIRRFDLRKPLFVIAIMGTFIGVWLFALKNQES